MQYIKGIDEQKGCFLCDAVREPDAPDSLIVHREAEAFVILNRYPYSNGHIMVAPTAHKAGLEEISDGEMLSLLRLARRCAQALTRSLKAQGYNVGLNIGKAAGAGLKDHLHLHLVPRWLGDTNFMAVLADVRVISQALLELREQLRAEFRNG
jgi:ATP adenylyltransferase